MHNKLADVIKYAGNFLLRDYYEIESLTSIEKKKSFFQRSYKRTFEIISDKLQPLRLPVYCDQVENNEESSYCLVNPISDINNFIFSSPFFSTLILVKIDGNIRHIIIYFPVLGEICRITCDHGVFFEDLDTAKMIRLRLLSDYYNELYYVNKLSANVLSLIKSKRLPINYMRINGSALYSIFLMIRNKADHVILSDIDDINSIVINTLVTELGLKAEFITDKNIVCIDK